MQENTHQIWMGLEGAFKSNVMPYFYKLIKLIRENYDILDSLPFVQKEHQCIHC